MIVLEKSKKDVGVGKNHLQHLGFASVDRLSADGFIRKEWTLRKRINQLVDFFFPLRKAQLLHGLRAGESEHPHHLVISQGAAEKGFCGLAKGLRKSFHAM